MADLDLTGVLERIRWAHQHRLRVGELTHEWARRAIDISMSDPDDSGQITYRATVSIEPGADIELALGDTLHNARASLDGLVSALRGGPAEGTQFIVTRSPTVFQQATPERLRGVPAWGVDAIRAMQPFPDDKGWRHVGESLERLHLLAILDRHRALLLRSGLIDLHETGVSTSEGAEVQFALPDGGRTLTITYRVGDVVSPKVGTTAYVDEEPARWHDAGYPPSASAPEVARDAIWAAHMALERVMAAANANGVDHDPFPSWYPNI